MTETWGWREATPYSGRPDSDLYTKWEPSMTRGNVLGGAPAWGGWACGSLSWNKHVRQGGLYEMTLKVYPHPILSFHLLLWPEAEHWPPEIDLLESFRSDRTQMSSFIHGRGKQEFPVKIDPTKPIKIGCRWNVGSECIFTYNDHRFGETTKDVPNEPMRLAIQVETHTSRDGFTFDKSRVTTQNYGPPDPKLWVPVVEVSDVTYISPDVLAIYEEPDGGW